MKSAVGSNGVRRDFWNLVLFAAMTSYDLIAFLFIRSFIFASVASMSDIGNCHEFTSKQGGGIQSIAK